MLEAAEAQLESLKCKHTENTNDATNISRGTHTFTCSVCDESVTEACSGGTQTCLGYRCEVCEEWYGEVNAENHAGETRVENKADPDCENGGYTGDIICECGETVQQGEIIPAQGHDFTKKLVATTTKASDATCTEAAKYYYSCKRCEALGTETFDVGQPKGHDYEAVVTEPTCTEQGFTTYTCSVCGDSYVADEVEAHGHNVVLVESEAATCELNGYEYYACEHCGGEEYTIILEATGHDYVDGSCSNCGAEDPNHKKPTIKDWFDKWFGGWFGKPSVPSEPTEPEVPSEPETPTEPSEPQKPSKPGFGGIFDWFFGWWR